LDALGCLNSNTVLVHGVALTERDIDRIIERRCRVVWCPSSNLTLLGRTLDPRRLFDAGLLALGTDARISASQDILEELRIASAHSDLTPDELFRLATKSGAETLAMPEVGGLAPGQMADCVIVRDSASSPTRGLLQLKRSDIRAVVRGGVPVIADPDFADWFDLSGCSTVEMLLDGRPKLCYAGLLSPAGIETLEPGFLRSKNDGHGK
jgi:cytosine/adenosine deaminase-related metal-dependent hydrolase